MCDYCHGINSTGCPNCSPRTDICPECDGHGKIYYLWDEEQGKDIRVPYEEYKKKEDSLDAVFEPCPHCDGCGWVVV